MSRYIADTIEYKGYSIEIVQDDTAQNPRSWKCKGEEPIMTCWHRKYTLGDEQPKCDPDEWLEQVANIDTDVDDYKFSREDCIRMIEEQGTVILPLYLYDHSGITMSTGKFGCPWDSGQVGWIYCTKKTIEKEGWAPEKAALYMEGEVETYDDWLIGNVYGYDIETADGNDTGEACSGFYGDPDKSGVIEEAKRMVDYMCQKSQEEYEKLPKYSHAEMATI